MGSARRVQKLQQQQRFHRVDANGSKTYLYLLIYLLFPIASADPATSPWNIDFATTVGLDGPWNAIVQTVSWPIQNITMFPSLTTSNLFVEASACSRQASACQLSPTDMWTGILGPWSWMNSTEFDAASWDVSLEPLRLGGRGTMISDRITLEMNERDNVYLDYIANAIDENFTVTFPGTRNWYTLDTGFFSLNGTPGTVDWTSVNGSKIALNKTLPLMYDKGDIPSTSYGLHIGSASNKHPVSGSLVLGGYDRSRCLTNPIQSDSNDFTLLDVGLGVAKGGSPFSNITKLPKTGLLRLNGSSASQVRVFPNPGVPYMYLPQDTCSAIADLLPVTVDDDLGLYLWNVSHPTFKDIMSSPSYISFSFASNTDDADSTIHVPFTLLNLTLENPLVSTPVQYFPCSPYVPSDGSTYHLGRAFLQSSFLGQNWQTQKVMLAQAPGPDFATPDIKTILSTDETVTPMMNAPSWAETWSSTLSALSEDSINSTSSRKHRPSSNGISNGAIVGVVIGAIFPLSAMIVLLVLGLRRRRKNYKLSETEKHDRSEPNSHGEVVGPEDRAGQVSEMGWSSKHTLPAELDGKRLLIVHEMDSQAQIGEFEGDNYYTRRGVGQNAT